MTSSPEIQRLLEWLRASDQAPQPGSEPPQGPPQVEDVDQVGDSDTADEDSVVDWSAWEGDGFEEEVHRFLGLPDIWQPEPREEEEGDNSEPNRSQRHDPSVVEEWLTRPENGMDWAGGAMETLAWYQPITFHGANFGIVMTERGIQRVARSIYADLIRSRRPLPVRPAAHCLNGSMRVLLAHERFHHRVESLAIRLLALDGQPRYADYVHKVYEPNTNPLTDDLLEETLASASEQRFFDTMPKSVPTLDREVWMSTLHVLQDSWYLRPPSYRTGDLYVNSASFSRGCQTMASIVSTASILHPTAPSTVPRPLKVANGLFDVPVVEQARIVTRPGGGIPPFALTVSNSDIERLLKSKGFTAVPGGKGSHGKWEGPGSEMVVLPHRREQSGYKVLSSVAAAVGARDLNDLKRLARSA